MDAGPPAAGTGTGARTHIHAVPVTSPVPDGIVPERLRSKIRRSKRVPPVASPRASPSGQRGALQESRRDPPNQRRFERTPFEGDGPAQSHSHTSPLAASVRPGLGQATLRAAKRRRAANATGAPGGPARKHYAIFLHILGRGAGVRSPRFDSIAVRVVNSSDSTTDCAVLLPVP